MAEQATATAKQVREFTVEFGDECNRTITINTLRLRVRGSWSLEALHRRPQGGRDVGAAMQSMPAIPGLRMKVVPRLKRAILYDPLDERPELLDRINKVARTALHNATPYRPQERVEHNLTDDALKSLLRDLRMLQDECHALKVVEGELPDHETIAALPGRELYDPWYSGHAQPRFRDDIEAWMRDMERRN